MSRTVLTAVEFAALWERLAPGPTPVALRLPTPARAVLGWPDARETGGQAG